MFHLCNLPSQGHGTQPKFGTDVGFQRQQQTSAGRWVSRDLEYWSTCRSLNSNWL
jgi:hypothetical protein